LLVEIPMGFLAERAVLDSNCDYENLSFSQLSALCAQRGLRAFAPTKQILIKRLLLNDTTRVRTDSKDSESFRKIVGDSKVDDRPPRKVLRVIPRSTLEMADLSNEFCTVAKYESELTTKAVAAMCTRYDIPHKGHTKQRMARHLAAWKLRIDSELSDLCVLMKTGKVYCLTSHQHFDIDLQNLAKARELLPADFSIVDTDGSGTIDEEELKTILNQSFLDKHTIISKESCKLLIQTVDLDGNGVVDQFEYSGLQNRLRAWKRDFDSYDHSHSGFVHYGEVNSMCAVAGYHFSHGFYKLLEKTYDTTHEKGLDFDLIVKLLAQLAICHDVWVNQLVEDEANLFSSATTGAASNDLVGSNSAHNASSDDIYSKASMASSAARNTIVGAAGRIYKKISRHLSTSSPGNPNSPNKSKDDVSQSQQANISHDSFLKLCKKLGITIERAEKSWSAFDLNNSGVASFTFEEFVYSTCVATKV